MFRSFYINTDKVLHLRKNGSCTHFFKELELEPDNIFTANFTRENKTKNVIFSQDVKYAITGLRTNLILAEEKLLKLENIKEQAKISQEIQCLIKNYKEPDLTLF